MVTDVKPNPAAVASDSRKPVRAISNSHTLLIAVPTTPGNVA